jgi:chromosomal replication initiation ATPase DnaA
MNWQEKRKKEIEHLFAIINDKLSVKKEQLVSKSRKRELVLARRYLMNILFEEFEETDKVTHGEIATVISKDRTSFIHHRHEHLNHYKRYKDYKREYDSLKKEFENGLK